MPLTPQQQSSLMKKFVSQQKPSVTSQQLGKIEKKIIGSPAPPAPKQTTGFVGPIQKEIPVKPTELTSQEKQIQQTITELEHQPVAVTFKTPTGETKTVQTTRFKKGFQLRGDILSVSPLLPSGGRGPAALVSRGPGAYETARKEFAKTKQVPEWYRKQVTPPSIIRELSLESKYLTYTYGLDIGHWEADATKQQEHIQRMIERNITPEVAKKYYTFDGKTFSQLKKEEPALFITGTGQGLKITRDINRWQKEQHARAVKEKDYGYLLGEFLGQTFTPRRIDYATASLFGTGTRDPLTGRVVRKPESFLAAGQYSFYQKYRKGDYPGIAIEAVQSPLVFPVAVSGVFKGATIAARVAATGFKTAISKTPAVFGRLSSMLPEKQFVIKGLSGGRTIGRLTGPTKTMIGKAGQTGFSKNIYRWASQGYKPLNVYTRTGPGVVTRSESRHGWAFTEGVMKKTLFSGKSRMFVSPSEYYRAALNVQQSKFGYIGFPKSGGGPSIFTKPLGYKSKLFRGVQRTETSYYSTYKFPISRPGIYEQPGFIRGPSTNVFSGFSGKATKIDWLQFKAGYYEGYDKYLTGESFKVFSPEKKWHLLTLGWEKPKAGIKPVLSDTSGSQAISIVQRPISPGSYYSPLKGSSALSKKWWYKDTVSIPSRSMVPSFSMGSVSMLGTGILSGSMFSSRPSMDMFQGVKPSFNVGSIETSALSSRQVDAMQYDVASRYYQNVLSVQDQFTGSQLVQKQASALKQQYYMPLVQKTKKRFAAPVIFPIPATTAFRSRLPRPFIIPSFDGETFKAKKRKPIELLDKGYRYRRWKVPRMEDLIGGY